MPDRARWFAALAPVGPFDDGGRASGWRPATIRSTEKGYGTYLGWLQMRGMLDGNPTLDDRVDRDRIQSFLDDYRPGRSDLTVATTVRGIAYMLRATVPPDGSPWLTKLAHRLINNAAPSRPKPPRMALPQELLALADRLIDDGSDLVEKGRRSGAPLFRDGLMIATLVARPLRLRNLAALRLNSSLTKDPGSYKVAFAKEQTKNGVPIAFHYPDWLTPSFDRYLRDIRPLLLHTATDDGSLWIGRRGRPLTHQMITIRIGNLTQRFLDRRVSPHLFRDISATAVAIHDPMHVGITKTLLGHTALKSSQQFYNQANSFAAAKAYGDLLTRLREGKED